MKNCTSKKFAGCCVLVVLLLASCATTRNKGALAEKENAPAEITFDTIGSGHGCYGPFIKAFSALIQDNQPHKKYQLIEGQYNLSELLSCGLTIASEGNMDARSLVYAYFENKLNATIQSAEYSSVMDLFSQLEGLVNVPSEQAMLIALEYFSTATTSYELGNGDQGDFVIGFPVFQDVILPLMSPEHRSHYRQLYIDMYGTYLKTAPDNDNLKRFHKSFYPIIKNAWDKGDFTAISTIQENKK